ncbi:hypothetical protein NUU61_005318 [Penicillium alfredii]|uniref:Uncharacterized protein n=1 Tax=Penicillium alfredii TaxID=1506179 RepID=A0A9W9F9L0_9EURO|nr:uncharacterized protein NUU61_005318 [Penicillium alfredii]KAJ5095962.1 hypothetical protein NUU61_005318 [Penicillium alfredii]
MSALRNSRTATVQARGFASSASLRTGPESPRFIEIPPMVQATNPVKPRIKGSLPVPRELFPARRADKPNKAYLDAVAPFPKTERKPNPRSGDPEKAEFKHKMSVLRRDNLRQGLEELHKRKESTESSMMKKSIQSQHQRNIILNQPEREDERLTRPSIAQKMQPRKQSVLQDHGRKKRIAFSKERIASRKALKQAEKEDHLHSLYMNARTFIMTEEQLAAEIDRVFPKGENDAWRSDMQAGDNIWNLGLPPSLFNLVTNPRKSETERWDVSQGRVQKLGEQLTGGKL